MYKNPSNIRSFNMENVFNFQSLANDVIYAQPRIYKSQRIFLGERSNAEITYNRDNSSPSPTPRLHVEMYPMRYTSPNMTRERRFNEKEEDDEEDEEDEDDEIDQENDCASRVTRF